MEFSNRRLEAGESRCHSVVWSSAGLTNVLDAAFTALPILFLFLLPDQLIYTVKNMCIFTHFCVGIVYKLPLLPNNTANETLLHKSGAVRSVDGHHWGAGLAVTERICNIVNVLYSLLWKEEVGVATRYFHSSFLFAFLEEAFVRNIIIILCIYYTTAIIISTNTNNTRWFKYDRD